MIPFLTLPGGLLLDYIDIYFDTFHQDSPFLHRSTFDFAKGTLMYLFNPLSPIGLWVKRDSESETHQYVYIIDYISAFYAQMVRKKKHYNINCI